MKISEKHTLTISYQDLEEDDSQQISNLAKKIIIHLSEEFSLYHYGLTSKKKNKDMGVELSGFFNKMTRSDKVAFASLEDIDWSNENLSSYSIVGFKNLSECLSEIKDPIEGFVDLEDVLLESDSELFLFEFYDGELFKVHCNKLSTYHSVIEYLRKQ